MKTDPDLARGYLIYNRKSTDDAENQKNSLAYQRQRNLAYAKQESLPIAPLSVVGYCEGGIIDEKHSGYREEVNFAISADGLVQHRVLRPKFLWLVRLLNEKKIKGVIFLSWDRASRNQQDSILIQKLKKQGCDIRFAETTYDRSSAGELHMNVDGIFSSHYSRVISEKVHNAYAKLHAEGRCTYRSPIGYLDYGSDRKILDPERAPVIKRIFELYATGEWSFRELGKWARQQGLTQKPQRRKRTAEELLHNIDLASLPKIARPVDHKTIEYILHNPFYAGKIKVAGGYQTGRSHPALVGAGLFQRVQTKLKSRTTTLHHIDRPFYEARGFVRCRCGRAYSPYRAKGIVYYRSRCKSGCDNPNPNLAADDITAAVSGVLGKIIRVVDVEKERFERESEAGFQELAVTRNRALADLHARHQRFTADLDYLAQNRVMLIRTGAMTPDALNFDQERLSTELNKATAEIADHGAPVPEMARVVTTFTELINNAGLCYEIAPGEEKRRILKSVFTELVFADKNLVKYEANGAFGAFLSRPVGTGSAIRTFSELFELYSLVKQTMQDLKDDGTLDLLSTYRQVPEVLKSSRMRRKAA